MKDKGGKEKQLPVHQKLEKPWTNTSKQADWRRSHARRCSRKDREIIAPVPLISAYRRRRHVSQILLAANAKAGTQDGLEACRQQIDSLDQRLVELIQERARVVQQVGAIKREAHLPVTDTGREQRVIRKAEELANGGPLPPEAVGRIYQKLVEEMRNWESGAGRK
jgi:chorismate mutase